MREKIQINRKGRVINPATIAKTLVTLVILYLNEITAIYVNNIMVIYLNETANLLELENQRGIRLSYPEISERLDGIIKEAVNRPIRSGVNKEL